MASRIPRGHGSGGQRRAGKGSEKRNDIMVARGFTFCVCVCVWPEGFAREGQTLLEAQGLVGGIDLPFSLLTPALRP